MESGPVAMSAAPAGRGPGFDQPPRVVVVGGGLAGMAAAVALESAGCSVTLLEARQRLGGRAGSHRDPRTGEELDSCQHVLLGCCTNLQDFYRRIGAAHLVRFERAIRFVGRDGRRYSLAAVGGLPAPLHLGPGFARFGLLSAAERAATAHAMLAMLRIGRAGRGALADTAFGHWLDAHGQPASLVEKLYDPVLVGALNEETRRASAAHAIHVFQDALLMNSGGYAIGVPTVPLSRLYESLPCRDVRVGTRVGELEFADSSTLAGVRLASGEFLRTDAVVLATGYHSVARWIPPEASAGDERFAGLEHLQSVPILGAYLRFDRDVMDEPHAALSGGPLQWVFRGESGRVLHGVISAARAWVDVPRTECLDRFASQVREIYPKARGAGLEFGTVVVEKRATFAAVPGVDRHRPSQGPPEGGIRNLYLAGDYTQTGWPATMEGAVRSGYLAAEAVLARATPERTPQFVLGDLPVQWPGRLLQKR